MKTFLAFLICFMTLQIATAQNGTSTVNLGQQQPAAATPAGSPLQSGSLIYAELSKSIDSKKAKMGDPVVAKVSQAVLSHGKIVIPKNSKIIGHLTAAKARSKDEPQAQLGIAFDRAELKDGSQIPLTSLTIQALASAVSLDQPPSNVANGTGGMPDSSGMPSSRGTNAGTSNPAMGGSSYPASAGTAADNTSGAGPAMPANAGAQLNANSRGVSGMPGVKLEPQAQGGLVSVEGKNVKLDSGTQMVLRSQ